MKWNKLNQERITGHWWTSVKLFQIKREFLDQLHNYQLLKDDPVV